MNECALKFTKLWITSLLFNLNYKFIIGRSAFIIIITIIIIIIIIIIINIIIIIIIILTHWWPVSSS